MTTSGGQRLVIVRTVEPEFEPVSVADIIAHSRIDDGSENDLIATYIKAATRYCEKITSRQFVQATYRLSLDRFPVGIPNDPTSPAIEGDSILLPRPNLLSVLSIKYDDEDGVEQTMSASDYRVLADECPARIDLAYDASWPDTRSQRGAVRILYEAGYADISGIADDAAREAAAKDAVPDEIKLAIKQLVATWFEHRESFVAGVPVAKIEHVVERLLTPHKVGELW